MTGFFDIELSGLRFFSHHGLYAEEEKLGAEFEINITIRYAARPGLAANIHNTIDYVTVYEMVKTEMGKRTELLETTATSIAAGLKAKFDNITNLRITIKKLAPPITNFIGGVSVTYEQAY